MQFVRLEVTVVASAAPDEVKGDVRAALAGYPGARVSLAYVGVFPDDERWQVIADGTPWLDPDGHSAWRLRDAQDMAAHVESLGYTAEVRPESLGEERG